MESLTAHTPAWLTTQSEAPEPVVACQCALARNLSDFVFPHCCIDDERRALESRIADLLSYKPDIPAGRYHPIGDMDALNVRLLAERRLITYEMLCADGPRGVFVSDDQSLAVMVNGHDHIVIRAISAVGKLEDAWKRADKVDSALGAVLDYSFHDRLGYLTRSLRMVGTGLKASVLLHLPGLVMNRTIEAVEERLSERRLLFSGVALGDPRISAPPKHAALGGYAYGLTATVEPASSQCLYTDMLGALAALTERTVGNLFLLSNQDTLGVSEVELIFQVEQAAQEIAALELETRQRLRREQGKSLFDSIGRALGVAGGAHRLGMGEALTLASLIRMADALGNMAGFDRAALNKTLLECQSAHLQAMRGVQPDAHSLAVERARMFRTLFSGATIN